MARQARMRSSTGIYPRIMRGIGKRNLFIEVEDKNKFIERLASAKTAS